MQQEEEGERMEKVPGIPMDWDTLELEYMQLTNNTTLEISSSRTINQENTNWVINYMWLFDHLAGDFENIGSTELDSAYVPDMKSHSWDQVDNPEADRWISALVRVVTVWAVKQLSELSHC